MKGLSPWLVLIGPTPLKLEEDWFTAVVILKSNPSPTGSFIIVFKRRKIVTCVILFGYPLDLGTAKELGSASSSLGERGGQTALGTKNVELALWGNCQKPSKQASVQS